MRPDVASLRVSERGLTLVELAIAIAVLALTGALTFQSLLVFNRNAASVRVLTTAKEVVQRNMENALGAAFDSTNSPPILAITAAGGEVWDDDGGGNNLVSLLQSRDATVLVSGTLRRIVAAETNSLSADIRRVTFRINYTLYRRSFAYEMTTIRARDK